MLQVGYAEGGEGKVNKLRREKMRKVGVDWRGKV